MQLPCPSCQATLALPDDAAGRTAQCPSCQSTFRVPSIDPYGQASRDPIGSLSQAMNAVINDRDDAVGCPGCDRLLAFNSHSAGQIVICPSCQRRVQMPTAAAMRRHQSSGGAETLATVDQPTSERGWATPQPQPILRNDDPYAAPPMAPAGLPLQEPMPNYALPGGFLAGISVLNLFYDVAWIGMALLGIGGNGGPADVIVPVVFMVAWGIFSLSLHTLTLLAGIRMTQRQSLGLVRIGAIAGLIPCGICNVLQLPFAIWALVLVYANRATIDFEDS